MKSWIRKSIFVGLVMLSGSVIADKINVVILTGSNNHKWQDTTPVLKEILEQSGKFMVDVVTQPEELTFQKLANYDVLLSNWNNWVGKKKKMPKPAPWSDALKKAYIDFVKNGGGHVMIHAGSSSFFEWEDYQKICIATWELGKTGHGAKIEFDARITDVKHPITQGMSDFKTTDELWHRPLVCPEATVLVESYSIKTQNWEPSAMVSQFGEGRCYALMYGHGSEHMQTDGFQTLLIRGVEWAGLK